MEYALTCPDPSCGHTMTVTAQNDDEAMERLLQASGVHAAQVHPQMSLTEEQGRAIVRVGMRRIV